jgi:hypothetical protein
MDSGVQGIMGELLRMISDPLVGLEAEYQKSVLEWKYNGGDMPVCPSCGGEMINVDCWLTCYDECTKCGWTFCEG